MSTFDFSTAPDIRELTSEIACLKALLAQILQVMGQADAGRAILKMEKHIAQMEDKTQAEVFYNCINQIKEAYRQ